ncbi:hypothetical protein [Aliidiomarina maris]|uniref:Lipoprotein n=1 Tax=Aliidiomarina maris TaxID=531312 RepID=A0A327WP18_9GAMM|nr:hypothetical protein [Aliidiomarina maris]RAJ93274.1 hypothetical protein B0I24_1201 [Aliidiomarina maris]RUO18530.1 hypothetical protein CWE07_13605 [Aliidiomarina maris]
MRTSQLWISSFLALWVLTGCASFSAPFNAPQPQATQQYSNLTAADRHINMVLIDERQLINQRRASQANFNEQLSTIRAREGLAPNFEASVRQFVAHLPNHDRNWRETYTYILVFYVDGLNRLEPLRGLTVRNSAGERISESFQVSPEDHMLEITISGDKYRIREPLQVEIARSSGAPLQFTVPVVALPNRPNR